MKPLEWDFLKPYFLSAVSGLLLVFVFPPFNVHLLAWVALVPFLAAVSGRLPADAAKYGLVTGLVYFGGILPWIVNALGVYGHIGPALSILLMLVLVSYLALYISLFGWITAKMGRDPEAILLAPFIFVIVELLRGELLTGYPWALLAHSQHTVPEVIQIASVTGAAGVTFLIMAVNAAICYSYLKHRQGEKAYLFSVAIIGLALLNFAWGHLEIKRVEGQKGTEFKAALIQGNIYQDNKWDNAYRRMILKEYFGMTYKASRENPDVIIWPETAIPFYYGSDRVADQRYSQNMREMVATIKTPLLFGSMGIEREEGGDYVHFNRAWVLDPSGAESHYDKVHLVPFGEYVPIRRILFFVENIDAVGGDLGVGQDATPVDIGGVPAGVQICYEIIFAKYSRRFARNGARIMVNITNDGWFGPTAASAQHMMSLPFRAVENRMPILRAANTGISGFVTATGKMKSLTPIFETLMVIDTVTIPPPGKMTFYTRFGDVFTFVCIFIVAAAWYRLRKKEKVA